MRVLEKMTLIDKIGRALQARFSYGEIDSYLAEYNIKLVKVDVNSKWVSYRNWEKPAAFNGRRIEGKSIRRS
jgi:hypothetical protein